MAEGPTTDSAKKPRAKKRDKTGSTPARQIRKGDSRQSKAEESSAIDQLLERAAGYSWLAPLIVIAAAVATSFVLGFGLGLLVAAGGTLLIVIGLLWASLQGLTENSPLSLEEALSLGAPSAEEEKKRAVLRTLKDLDYERGVGKISEEDYRQLSTRYRAEARDLLRALDGNLSDAREDATALMEAHFRSRGIAIPKRQTADDDGARDSEAPEGDGAPVGNRDPEEDSDEPGGDDSDGPTPDGPDTDSVPEGWGPPGAEAADDENVDIASTLASARDRTEPVDDPVDDPPGVRCPGCDTRNDDDARFCKSCGAEMEDA